MIGTCPEPVATFYLLGRSVAGWSVIDRPLLAIALGSLVVAWGYLVCRRPGTGVRLASTSAAGRGRSGGCELGSLPARGLLALLLGIAIALSGLVSGEVDAGLAVAFPAVSVLVVLWYVALTT